MKTGINQDWQIRKLSKVFTQLDTDGNGFLEWEDYLAEAKNILRRFGCSQDSEKGQALMQAIQMAWKGVLAADSNQDGRVSPEEFVAYYKDTDIKRVMALLSPIADAVVAICDTNGDGRISLEEFHGFPIVGGESEESIKASFRALDVDGKGYFTKDEYLKAWEEFTSGNDPQAPSNHIFGYNS